MKQFIQDLNDVMRRNYQVDSIFIIHTLAFAGIIAWLKFYVKAEIITIIIIGFLTIVILVMALVMYQRSEPILTNEEEW